MSLYSGDRHEDLDDETLLVGAGGFAHSPVPSVPTLTRLGVQHVVYPEKDMGKRVAHLVRGVMQDYVEIGDDFAAVRTTASRSLVGKTIHEAQVRDRYGVVVTAIKQPGQGWQHANRGTVIGPDDVLLVTGPAREAEAFSRMR